jgi:hypothetical protein
MKRGRQIKNKGPRLCTSCGAKRRVRDGALVPCECKARV